MQSPGKKVALDVWRDGGGMRMEVKADAVTANAGRLGVVLNGPTVAVTSVTQGSPADLAGIQPGDVLETIGKNHVTDVRQARQLIAEPTGQVILIEINRAGSRRRLSVDLAG